MTTPESLDPKSRHISLEFTPEVPEVASGINFTLSLAQSPDVKATFHVDRFYDYISLTYPESFDSDLRKKFAKDCRQFGKVLAGTVFSRLNEHWETVLEDTCREYLHPKQNVEKYVRSTLRKMAKSASANKAYKSAGSYQIYQHTIPADKTAGNIAVNLSFNLPSEINSIDSMSAHK